MSNPKPVRTGTRVYHPTIADLAVQRARELEVLRLATLERLSGVEIADRLGIDKSTVTRILQRVWARNEAPLVEHQRATQNANIGAVLATFLPRALQGQEKAAMVVLRYLEREAKLNGLDQQAASDAAGLAALLADPQATRDRIIAMRTEMAEARAQREAAGE